MSDAAREPMTKRDDVDDVIGLATEMMLEEQESLTREDLHAVGRELDVPPEYIEKARSELARRAAEMARTEAEMRARRSRLVRKAAMGAAALTLIFILWSWSAVSTVRERHVAVQTRAGQVSNVRDRQQAVTELLAGRPTSVDTDAERIGAENRVRVETQRYVVAAAAYNAAAGRFPASWVLPLTSLPSSVPMVP